MAKICLNKDFRSGILLTLYPNYFTYQHYVIIVKESSNQICNFEARNNVIYVHLQIRLCYGRS